MIPLNPTLTPRIELCREPLATVSYDDEYSCQVCGDNYALDIEGQVRQCVTCLIRKSGQQSIQLFGWRVCRTGSQLVTTPPTHRV
jgi:hypothetical protein